MTDREALLQCYLSGQMSAAQWERHCEDDPELRTMIEAKGGDANDGDGPSERSDGQNRPHDTSPGVKTGATDPIAAMREALKEIDARRYRRLFSNHPWLLSDFGNAYSCGSQQAHEECSDIARAALAAYDAAVAPSHQGTRFPRDSSWAVGPIDEHFDALLRYLSSHSDVAQEHIEIELRGFAARVAADHAREQVAAWMIAHSYPTGHGDTLDDLLHELVGYVEYGAAIRAQGGRE